MGDGLCLRKPLKPPLVPGQGIPGRMAQFNQGHLRQEAAGYRVGPVAG